MDRVFYIDNITGIGVDPPAGGTPPSTPAPTPPARDANDVISLYSGAYTATGITNFDAGWCGANSIAPLDINGDEVLAWKNNNCQGIEFNTIDATAFNKMHVDLYIAEGTDVTSSVFNLKFVDTADNDNLEVNFNAASSPPLVAGQWIAIDVTVDLSAFDKLNQFAVTSNLNNVAWYDNLYFYKDGGSGGGGGGAGEPTEDAPDAPTFNNANDVFSVFSSLGNASGFVSNSFAGATESTIQINGNDTKKLEIPTPGGGMNLIWGPPTDLTVNGLTHLYLHYYTEASGVGKVLNIQIQGGGANFIYTIDLNSGRNTGWQTVDVALSSLANYNASQLTAISQVQIVGAGPESPIGDFYIDNVMLYKGGTASNDDESLVESLVLGNPTDSQWTVRTPNAIIQSVQVFNILGKQVYTNSLNNNEVVIPAQNLRSGIYIARIQTDQGFKTIKLVRN